MKKHKQSKKTRPKKERRSAVSPALLFGFVVLVGSMLVSLLWWDNSPTAQNTLQSMCQSGDVVIFRCGSSYSVWPRQIAVGDTYRVINRNGQETICPMLEQSSTDPACNVNRCLPGDLCQKLN